MINIVDQLNEARNLLNHVRVNAAYKIGSGGLILPNDEAGVSDILVGLRNELDAAINEDQRAWLGVLCIKALEWYPTIQEVSLKVERNVFVKDGNVEQEYDYQVVVYPETGHKDRQGKAVSREQLEREIAFDIACGGELGARDLYETLRGTSQRQYQPAVKEFRYTRSLYNELPEDDKKDGKKFFYASLLDTQSRMHAEHVEKNVNRPRG